MSGMAARRCSLGMEDRRGHEEAIRRFLRRIEDRAPDEPDGQGKTDSLYSPQYEPCLFFQPSFVDCLSHLFYQLENITKTSLNVPQLSGIHAVWSIRVLNIRASTQI